MCHNTTRCETKHNEFIQHKTLQIIYKTILWIIFAHKKTIYNAKQCVSIFLMSLLNFAFHSLGFDRLWGKPLDILINQVVGHDVLDYSETPCKLRIVKMYHVALSGRVVSPALTRQHKINSLHSRRNNVFPMNPQGAFLPLLSTEPYRFQIPNTGNPGSTLHSGDSQANPACHSSSTTCKRTCAYICVPSLPNPQTMISSMRFLDYEVENVLAKTTRPRLVYRLTLGLGSVIN